MNAVSAWYGAIQALESISLRVPEGEIVTLIGANGAGKTTTLRAIAGLLRPKAGTISFDGRRIDGMEPDEIVRLGISLSPEGRRVFPRLTVLENLEMGAYVKRKEKAWLSARLERIFTLFPRLKERQRQMAETLSGGEQQMLAIGRAMMSGPRLLMLDEPSMGLAPIVVESIFKVIKEINESGATILLVEQNARMALRVAQTGYVLQNGKIVLHDKADRLLENDEVRRAYLGIRSER